MENAETQSLVASEFAALADTLGDVDEPDWDSPTLCTEWSVRQVVAHMTMAARLTDAELQSQVFHEDVDFEAVADRIARADGRLEPATLLDDLRSDRMATWAPDWGDAHDALNHVVVHGLDITVALGLPRRGQPGAIRTVLDDLVVGDIGKNFDVDSADTRYIATDLDRTFGGGSHTIRGTAEELVLHLTGRSTLDRAGTPGRNA